MEEPEKAETPSSVTEPEVETRTEVKGEEETPEVLVQI